MRGNGSGAIRDIRKVPAASMNGATPTYLATPIRLSPAHLH